ncbi:stage II sporulation protein R [Virgibacillus alimentarius]|uniref:Stage II sporulation protein R n=1 Tax=Virgibacillus alimentarius TaxID=698769 RepID=A0ABS4SBT9_9BACI|nr:MULTISPECIES: stage II sporulation protein R [Virgibacillus]MBP2258978.1 stage II sporulation protein R [Virgibacillus alimentarius]HLR67252.1 stage II sporulation protein R [Virgibacillus sp.]
MKKLVFFVIIFIILFFSMPMIGKGEENIQQDDYQVIPDEAIRLRILANSDSEADQALKREVRDRVNEEISKWVEDITDIDEARERIQSRVPEIEAIVADVLADEKKGENFQVEYRKNVTFPMKIYGSYLYPAGEYEAVLITLGKGEGANWWCVLFPPLCFLDFSSGTSVAEASTDDIEEIEELQETEEADVEVKFFLFEWFR